METSDWVMFVIGLMIIGSLVSISNQLQQLIKLVNWMDTETLEKKIYSMLEISEGNLSEIAVNQTQIIDELQKLQED